jgi:hypothetical protein
LTTRIISTEDITNILLRISKAEQEGLISHSKAQQYAAFVLFGAYTGQRTQAMMMKLKVRQFKEALQSHKPVIYVESSQDKIKMSHYVPVHPYLVEALHPLLDRKDNDKKMFEYYGFYNWVKRQKIPLARITGFCIRRPSQIH